MKKRNGSELLDLSASHLREHAQRMAEKGRPGALEALEQMGGGLTELDAGMPRHVSWVTGEEIGARLTPLHVRLPWSSIIADNRKYAPTRSFDEPLRPKIILSKEYRAAKRKIEAVAREQLGQAPAFTCPVALLAHVYEPDRRTRRDIANMTKVVHDALTGIAYADDSLIDDVRWVRMPPDIDAPRVELTITPL